MDFTELKANISREMTSLRQDLLDLKRCQLQYFTLAITGTGAILGFANLLAADSRGMVFLAPLCVVLPTWVIFFDKATTITRITGYVAVLEEQLCADSQVYKYVGYENALAEFRRRESEAYHAVWKDIQGVRPKLSAVLLLKTRHRFWMINWCTFALLAVISCLSASAVLTDKYVNSVGLFGWQASVSERAAWLGPAFILVALVAIYTFGFILSLTHGGLSYGACALKWRFILKLNQNDVQSKEIAKQLRCYSVDELRDGLKVQREQYDWDFSKEREFIENLFCQRFNFLLVIYSLFVAGAATAQKQTTLTTILVLGTALTFLVSLTIWRAFVKLIVNLRILHSMPSHPVEFIRTEVDAMGVWGLFGVNSIIGIWVPLFCLLSLAMGSFLAWFKIIEVG